MGSVFVVYWMLFKFVFVLSISSKLVLLYFHRFHLNNVNIMTRGSTDFSNIPRNQSKNDIVGRGFTNAVVNKRVV